MVKVRYEKYETPNLAKLKEKDVVMLRNGEKYIVISINKKPVFEEDTKIRSSYFEYEITLQNLNCLSKLKEESYTVDGHYSLAGEHSADIIACSTYFEEPDKVTINDEETFGEY